MAAVMERRPGGDYQEPGKVASAVLAVGMHVLLALVLFLGVRWQNRPPEAVTVELWTAPPAQVRIPEPAPPPRVEPRPEPKPEPRPEPRVEKPDIALEQEKQRRLDEERKAREAEAERQRRLAEQRKLDEEKKLAERRKAEEQRQLEERKKAEEQKRAAEEQRRVQQETRRRLDEQLAGELAGAKPSAGIPARTVGPANVAGATSGDTDAYRARIAAKIRSNVIVPVEVTGNPEAEFDVVQLPTGEVAEVRLRKSSGNRALDEAWERAIRKSSPLPRPDKAEAFRRELRLRFRPNE